METKIFKNFPLWNTVKMIIRSKSSSICDTTTYVWLVVKLLSPVTKSVEVGGIYTSKELALKNCLTEDYFIARIPLDSPAIDESYPMEYAWYPHLEDEPIITESHV